MGRNKKSRPAAGNSDPAGRNEAEQLTLDTLNHSTNVPTRQAQLKQYDAAMQAADQAGDIDGFCDAWQAWLDTFCGVSDGR